MTTLGLVAIGVGGGFLAYQLLKPSRGLSGLNGDSSYANNPNAYLTPPTLPPKNYVIPSTVHMVDGHLANGNPATMPQVVDPNNLDANSPLIQIGSDGRKRIVIPSR